MGESASGSTQPGEYGDSASEDALILDMFKKLEDKEKAAEESRRTNKMHIEQVRQRRDDLLRRLGDATQQVIKVAEDLNKVADTGMKIHVEVDEARERASLLLAESNSVEMVKEACKRRSELIQESMDLTLKGNQEKTDSLKRVIDYLQRGEREAAKMSKKLKLYAEQQTQRLKEIERIGNSFEEMRMAMDATKKT